MRLSSPELLPSINWKSVNAILQNPLLQFLISKKLVKRAQALGHIVGVYVEQS